MAVLIPSPSPQIRQAVDVESIGSTVTLNGTAGDVPAFCPCVSGASAINNATKAAKKKKNLCLMFAPSSDDFENELEVPLKFSGPVALTNVAASLGVR